MTLPIRTDPLPAEGDLAMTVMDDLLNRTPWTPAEKPVGPEISEVARLRSRTPASTAEWLAIQKRLAELEEQ